MLKDGIMGVVIAVVVRFIMTGMCSDVVIGIGLIRALCTALFDITISGVDMLLLKNVGKFRPKCIAFPLFMKVANPFPTVLLNVFPIILCLAFRSPMM